MNSRKKITLIISVYLYPKMVFLLFFNRLVLCGRSNACFPLLLRSGWHRVGHEMMSQQLSLDSMQDNVFYKDNSIKSFTIILPSYDLESLPARIFVDHTDWKQQVHSCQLLNCAHDVVSVLYLNSVCGNEMAGLLQVCVWWLILSLLYLWVCLNTDGDTCLWSAARIQATTWSLALSLSVSIHLCIFPSSHSFCPSDLSLLISPSCLIFLSITLYSFLLSSVLCFSHCISLLTAQAAACLIGLLIWACFVLS